MARLVGSRARKLALHPVSLFLVGTLLGSTLPETGNFVAYWLKMGSHDLNPVFLTLGLVGLAVAFRLRPKAGRVRPPVLVVESRRVE